jgi:hypothetical protein
MPGSKAVKDRIEQLIAEVPRLLGEDQEPRQRAWLVAAQNVVRLVYPPADGPYSLRAQQLVDEAAGNWTRTAENVSEMTALLARLLEEIELGLLTTIENHAIAVTFDDFLDHGAEYLKHGRKNEASGIAGIVFEDAIRRTCRHWASPRAASHWTR